MDNSPIKQFDRRKIYSFLFIIPLALLAFLLVTYAGIVSLLGAGIIKMHYYKIAFIKDEISLHAIITFVFAIIGAIAIIGLLIGTFWLYKTRTKDTPISKDLNTSEKFTAKTKRLGQVMYSYIKNTYKKAAIVMVIACLVLIWYLFALSNRISNVEDRIDNLENRVNSLRYLVNELQDSVDDVSGRTEDANYSIDDVMSSIDDLSSRVDDLESSVTYDLSDKVDSLEDSVWTLERKVRRLEY